MPKIDGLLNDEAWQKAAKVTGFWRLDKDELAEEQTEVRLLAYISREPSLRPA